MIRLEMSPLLVAATTTLLLACMHFTVGASDVMSVPFGIQQHKDATTNRTGEEAFRSAHEARRYLGGRQPDQSPCGHISLPCPLTVSGCNTSTNISRNLKHLLYMYSYVLRLNDSETNEKELDFLEMMFSRFSQNMEWYVQVSDATVVSVVDQNWILGEINDPLSKKGCTPKGLLKLIIWKFVELGGATVRLNQFSRIHNFGYRLCNHIERLNETCRG